MSMTINKRIEELKKLTIEREQDFSIPLNYFLTHIAENKAVMSASKPMKKNHDFYRQLLLPPLRNRFGISITLGHFILMKIKKTEFVHGFCMLSNGLFVTLYYFEDIKGGMAVVSDEEGSDFFRLTAWETKKPTNSVLAPHIVSKVKH